MLAIAASNSEGCGLGGKRGCTNDDTGYAYELRDVCSGEVADGKL